MDSATIGSQSYFEFIERVVSECFPQKWDECVARLLSAGVPSRDIGILADSWVAQERAIEDRRQTILDRTQPKFMEIKREETDSPKDPVGHKATKRRQKIQKIASRNNLSVREKKLLARLKTIESRVSYDENGNAWTSNPKDVRERSRILDALEEAAEIRKRWARRCQDIDGDRKWRLATKRARERLTMLGVEEIEVSGGTRLPSERKNGFMWVSNSMFEYSDNTE